MWVCARTLDKLEVKHHLNMCWCSVMTLPWPSSLPLPFHGLDLWSELLIEQFSLELKPVFEKKNVVIKILQQQKLPISISDLWPPVNPVVLILFCFKPEGAFCWCSCGQARLHTHLKSWLFTIWSVHLCRLMMVSVQLIVAKCPFSVSRQYSYSMGVVRRQSTRGGVSAGLSPFGCSS